MKLAGILFALGTVFFAVVTVVYGLWSQEWAGTTALGFTGFMTALIAFYTLYTAKRLDNRPEDSMVANQDEAAPDYGFYSPHSWWPLPLGIAAAVAALGFVFGWWMIVLGGFLIILSSIGLVFEHYRGDFAH